MNGWDLVALYHTLSGATMLGFFAVALFFLRFWRRTRDRLFQLFAISFAVMGVQRMLVIALQQKDERTELALYIMRFVAFLIILWAIIDKNRGGNRPGHSVADPDRPSQNLRQPALKNNGEK